MMDSYVYVITALLPLAASMLVCQVNPYHALVIRGILGAIAALTYTVLGAADVALTEALVGTLLAITLYAVAVRSSLVLRLGVLKDEVLGSDLQQGGVELAGIKSAGVESADDPADLQVTHFQQLLADLQTLFDKRHMRVELVSYLDQEALHRALMDKEVHATCVPAKSADPERAASLEPPYHITTRLRRLYEIMQTELVSPLIRFTDISGTNVSAADSQEG